ncbi:acyl-CoA N-acyltransferase [Penicillium chermesinum]|uniref:Acyl-CoA N-acyltransferase n=1 Tax=Penicillium chermesinum TaxID=63820 RepID=A0A9W9PKL1_9EURO|nr:acyl-CoA N-acyltransferase [Penicillium chermesinum]KAJ5249147.1 acyl-CoA N-acyltransferase [Penicillium chermesinum]KAJ6151244.1 acyl-CoA N-acyltransferase [Penicillium chermesinum]
MIDTTQTLQFRLANQDDASRIQQLVQSSFRTHDSRPEWTGLLELASSFSISVDEISANIGKPDNVFLMALTSLGADGDLVASIQVTKRGADIGRLSRLAVNDRYQRGGVGRQVLLYAEDYCQRTWGIRKFSLNTLSTRPALIAWYMRRGYQKTGETSPFPIESFAATQLPADLCFIEFEKSLG